MAGISTCALGHADPDLAAAVGDQMKKFHHVSNLYYIPEQVPHTSYPPKHLGLLRSHIFFTTRFERRSTRLKDTKG